MAKKQNNSSQEIGRQSRKEILQKRKEREQKRNVYIGAGIVLGLLAILFLVALIYELVFIPSQAVAEVNGEEISISEWEDRVRFERAQLIVFLEEQLAQFGDMSFILQQPTLVSYRNALWPDDGQPELFAQGVKDDMVDDLAIRQEAEARGITVTEAEIDEYIEEFFGYYGGELPTPFPTATATIEPTPSLTPIPTAVITEVLPTNTPFPTFTPAPTQPPPPTATPKSAEAYEQEWTDYLAKFTEIGISEAQYRESVRNILYRQKLADAIAEEQNLPRAVDHASFLFLFFENEEEANTAVVRIDEDGFLQVWNEIRSGVDDDEESSGFASEFLWSTEDTIAQTFGSETAEVAMTLDLETPSAVIVQEVDAETNRYFIIYLTGRELRDLSDAAYERAKQEALDDYLVIALAGNVSLTDVETDRAPSRPRLDPVFFEATPTPPIPNVTVVPEEPEESEN